MVDSPVMQVRRELLRYVDDLHERIAVLEAMLERFDRADAIIAAMRSDPNPHIDPIAEQFAIARKAVRKALVHARRSSNAVYWYQDIL